jgi:uncharacterized protein YjiK
VLHASQLSLIKSTLGLISALAFAPTYPASIFAAGSFKSTDGNIAVFDSVTETIIGYPSPPYGIHASVSQLTFNPGASHLLYAAFRSSNAVYEWDLRGDTSAPSRIFINERMGSHSNQRIFFDMDTSGMRLAMGGQVGFSISTMNC